MKFWRVALTVTATTIVILSSTSVAGAQACEGRDCPTATTSSTIPTSTTVVDAAPDQVLPDATIGDYPADHYDVGCSEGGWIDFTRKQVCAATGWAFGSTRVSVTTGMWVLRTVFNWGYDRVLTPIVDTVGGGMTAFTQRLGLAYWALLASLLFAVGLFLRGRLVAAVGEIAMSMLMIGAAAFMVGHLGTYYRGVIATMREASVLAIVATDPHPSDNPTKALDGFDNAMTAAFVQQPYVALNWGGEKQIAACQPAVDQILAAGPHGNSDDPRKVMAAYGTDVKPGDITTQADVIDQASGAAKSAANVALGPLSGLLTGGGDHKVALDQMTGPCVAAAKWNANPTIDRAAAALLAAIAALLVFALLLRIGVKQAWRGIRMAFGFMTLPLALAMAAFPGDARDHAFRWIRRIADDFVHVVGSFLVFGVVIAVMRSVLTVGVGDTAGLVATGMMLTRFALAIAVAAAGNFMMGGMLRRVGASLSRGVGRVATVAKPSSDRPAMFAVAAAAAGGAGVMSSIAAKQHAAARQINAAKTVGRGVKTTAGHVDRAFTAVEKAPGRAYDATKRRAQLIAGRTQQTMMTQPQVAARIPPVLRSVAHKAAAAGVATHAAATVPKPTARIVARGGSMPGAREGRRTLYVESAKDRRTIEAAGRRFDAGGTVWPSREAKQRWERHTEHRVARLVGQERRPLVEGDFDAAMPADRRDWAIARSRVYHRELQKSERRRKVS